MEAASTGTASHDAEPTPAPPEPEPEPEPPGPDAPPAPVPHHGPIGRRAIALASLGALGVVYGDIGTSPLYAIKECLAWAPENAEGRRVFGNGLEASAHAVPPNLDNVLGVLSLMFWALVLVVCLKYLVFVLRADNKGEGGILALAALVEGDERKPGNGKLALAVPILLGLFGTGLLFGDGAITPAISVLGAMEGLSEQSSALTYLVVPITVGILIGLFFVQRFGTGKIGVAFGPVMLLWFTAIGALGLRWILIEPGVLAAVDPRHGVWFLTHHGVHGFLLVGLVFLVVTGGEALYADMGHFGRRPIRIAWFAIALPGVLLNYFGQGAVLLHAPIGTVQNPFYEVADGFLIPMLVLATLAAVIASQALISGVFSITRQAMQLGYWPRVTVVHTSATSEGQIYIPEMNWLLMVGTLAVVLQFRSSTNLAAAYGIAVTGTMGITTYLFYLVCRRRWGYSQPKALAFLIPFLAIDLAFFSANAAKILDGGWVPLAIGVVVFVVMTTWWRGRVELSQLMDAGVVPDELFLADLGVTPVTRVRGTAVFMSSKPGGIPNVLMHHLKHNQVLHEQVVLFSVATHNVPWIKDANAIEVRDLGHGFFRVVCKVGFMQDTDVPKLLARCGDRGIRVDPMTTTYYLGRQTLLTTGEAKLARWRKLLFSFLARNARPPTAFFNLPPNRVVELGLQIQL